MRSCKSLYTACAVVGLGRPDILALGAAIGVFDNLINSRAISLSGMRTATVSSPPVTELGTISDLGKISVIGPGQNAVIIFLAIEFTSFTILCNIFWSFICSINGLSDGLPFAL